MSLTALLDADIIAYKAASKNEGVFDFFDGPEDSTPCVDVNEEKTYQDAIDAVDELANAVEADQVIICLSDPERNWRKTVYPDYKSNRKGVRRPELLETIKQFLASEYPSYRKATLEADDVMGILATHPTLIPGQKIIVSEDKDMRTIPATIYNPNRPEVGIIEVSELDADRFHAWQTVVGDQTDGYPGAKGVGKSSVYAEELIFADADEIWDIVIDAYCSKGLTELDAITQARCARICRHTDYDFQRKRVKLWEPPL